MAASTRALFVSPLTLSHSSLFPAHSPILRPVTTCRHRLRARVVPKRPRVQMQVAESSSKPPVLTPAVAGSSISQLLSYLHQLSKKYPFVRVRVLLAIFCIISSKLVALCTPFLFQSAVDHLTLNRSKAFRNVILALVLHGFSRTLSSFLHESRNIAFVKAAQRLGRAITAMSFEHIHSLEVAFHNSTQTGILTRVIDRGTRSVMTIFRGILFSFFPSLFELSLVLIVLLKRFSPWYAAVTLTTFVIYIAWTLYINDELGVVRSAMNEIENSSSAKLTDSLINVESVKAYGNEAFELKRYDESLEMYEKKSLRNERLYVTLNFGQGFIFTVGLTAILLRAAVGVTSGTLSIGSLVLLSSMLHQLWIPLNFLGWQYREVKQSLIDVQNLFELLKRNPAIVDKLDSKQLVVSNGDISFLNVSFRYPSDEQLDFLRKPHQVGHQVGEQPLSNRLALDNVSFHIKGGTSLALVGESGSGKSTATRLLFRLYEIQKGQILIDGQDIADMSIESLKKAVSIIPQDTALFNDTIAYNIRYGRPDATDEEVIAAAKAASIHHVIMRTPQGYDTLVGERGVRLSGGERQRLSVARAFLKGSRIILEDESTSALDTLTELQVTESLQRLGLNRTRVIVAHRLSTIMNVDQIVVLRKGRKVEEGTFDELVSKEGGVFRDMWERQQRKGDDSEGHDSIHERDTPVLVEKRNFDSDRMEGDAMRGSFVEN